MSEEIRDNELVTLKVIAETLNRSNDLRYMLQSVLEKLLKVTGLSTGWIFLVDEKPIYAFVADYHLPPALTWGEKKPMCEGSCWCLDKYWDGRLKQAVNIINCKRIEDAIEHSWGDTKGITHHATVPLTAGGEMFGVLNVASPGKEHFNDEELTLLQSIAYQIGTAVKRTKLFQAQQRRAENFAKLDEVTRFIWKLTDLDELPTDFSELPEEVARKIANTFQLSEVGLFMREGNKLVLQSAHPRNRLASLGDNCSVEEIEKIKLKLDAHEEITEELCPLGHSHTPNEIAVPLVIRDEIIGAIVVYREQNVAFEKSDVEVLKALAAHLSLAVENIRLYKKRQELTLLEERNRLARDLHDSVSQKLFSLSLTARGVKEIMPKEDAMLVESLEDIQGLSQEALSEMRSLIWQLRPPGLEVGVLTALKKYGEGLGLLVEQEVDGVKDLPKAAEEALWRIGQEALNNVRKHAKSSRVNINLKVTEAEVRMEITDHGCGFELNSSQPGKWSLGLSSMKERAELIGGAFFITSAPGKGTSIFVLFPLAR